ncbi:hatching enzyme 1.2-like isoform X2 [Ambystoma mexicanum]|uniref:hatching enzyme 1.2-like isoform X2 n=1 Tax=Ambystoma mexicanum TaxID=8296 RepID=UPI0037E996A9
MGARAAIVYLGCLVGCTLSAPAQTSVGNIVRCGQQSDADVFSIIAKCNEGAKKPMTAGDIAVKTTRSALGCKDSSCFWPKTSQGNVNVPYTLSTAFNSDEQAVIASAIQEFTTLTCIRFVARTVEIDYIQIKSVDGCWSYLGKVGGPQDLSLLKGGCVTKGIAQHELNHALGFVHEQTRSDRDQFVDIIWKYIPQAVVVNFEKAEPETNNLGIMYDYGSVMHYGSFAFTNTSGQATIVPRPDSSKPIGQRYGLSNLDISKINKLYQCGLCSSLLTDRTGSLSSNNIVSSYPNTTNCVYQIRIPSDKVYLTFDVFDLQDSTGCLSGYIKVYDGAHKMAPVLLDKTCGKQRLPLLVASDNLMLVEYSSTVAVSSNIFKASYSAVQCGRTLTDSSGTLSSPNYPSTYGPNTNCSWVIVAPKGFKISVSILDFSLEASTNCVFDYLLIMDDTAPTTLVGKYCGKPKFPNITSYGNTIRFKFISDMSVQSKGFQLKYITVRSS